MVRVLEETSWNNLEEQIRGVPLLKERQGKPFYPYADADITLASTPINETTASTLYVIKRNLAVHQQLAQSLAELGYDPLSLEGGITIEDDDGMVHKLIPPVVEQVPEHDRMVLDGQHRLYVRLKRIQAFAAVVITNVHPEALAYAIPNSWDEIIEYDEAPSDLSLKKRYRSDDHYILYRDFSSINGSKPRP